MVEKVRWWSSSRAREVPSSPQPRGVGRGRGVQGKGRRQASVGS